MQTLWFWYTCFNPILYILIIVARFQDTLSLGESLQKLHNRAERLIMNLKNEHGQSVLARNSLGWKSLEERRVEMKARIMYKTVNMLACSRLYDIFQNVNKIADYILRGSSTRICIPMPKTEYLRKRFSML